MCFFLLVLYFLMLFSWAAFVGYIYSKFSVMLIPSLLFARNIILFIWTVVVPYGQWLMISQFCKMVVLRSSFQKLFWWSSPYYAIHCKPHHSWINYCNPLPYTPSYFMQVFIYIYYSLHVPVLSNFLMPQNVLTTTPNQVLL